MKRNLQPEIKGAIDARLEDAISKSNYRLTLNNQLQNARLKADKALTHSVNGGIFKITPDLISFVQTLRSMEHEDAILLDVNNNPIDISDLKTFQEELVQKYYETMNEFLVEFKSIRQNRNTASVLEV